MAHQRKDHVTCKVGIAKEGLYTSSDVPVIEVMSFTSNVEGQGLEGRAPDKALIDHFVEFSRVSIRKPELVYQLTQCVS